MWEKPKVFWTRIRASLPLIGLVVASACGLIIYYLIKRANGHDSSGPKRGTGSPKEVVRDNNDAIESAQGVVGDNNKVIDGADDALKSTNTVLDDNRNALESAQGVLDSNNEAIARLDEALYLLRCTWSNSGD